MEKKSHVNSLKDLITAQDTDLPQSSRDAVDAFCDAPVVPVLKHIGGSAQLDTLRSLLEQDTVRVHAFRPRPDTVDFGDLANLITEFYYAGPEEENRRLSRQLLDIYFTCLDVAANVKGQASGLQAVCGFLNTPFSDYYRYAMRSGILPKDQAKHAVWFAETGLSADASVREFYRALKAAPEGRRPELDAYEPLVGMFALPVAIIINIPFE